MTDQDLENLIDRLNSKHPEGIFLRPLTDTVSLAKVWPKIPSISDSFNFDGPSTFYFISNSEGLYVGAVLVMFTDLHWLILPEYRGNGYLTKALKEVILFHLFEDSDEIRITIDPKKETFLESQKVALKVGFLRKEGTDEYFLAKAQHETNEPVAKAFYEDNSIFAGKDTGISQPRFLQLKTQMSYLYRSLYVIESEIQMTLDDQDLCGELEYLRDKIRDTTIQLSDMADDFLYGKRTL